MLIDTHCHYNLAAFDEDRSEAIERAREAGVERAVVIGYHLASSEWAVRLAEEFPDLYAVVGIHPNDGAEATPEGLDRIEKLAAHPKVVALGEIGLDYHWNVLPPDHQRAVFVEQLRMARRLGLPIILHTRESDGEVVGVLEEEGGPWRGILHCFGGDPEVGQRALAAGLHLGLGGVLTFKNARQLQETARTLPLERIVLETDSPYLTPMPHRGKIKRNEPSFLPFVARHLASLRGMTEADVADVTTQNAVALLGMRGDSEPNKISPRSGGGAERRGPGPGGDTERAQRFPTG
jgi:TatD DNase family protein